jgi:hypothetical protein
MMSIQTVFIVLFYSLEIQKYTQMLVWTSCVRCTELSVHYELWNSVNSVFSKADHFEHPTFLGLLSRDGRVNNICSSSIPLKNLLFLDDFWNLLDLSWATSKYLFSRAEHYAQSLEIIELGWAKGSKHRNIRAEPSQSSPRGLARVLIERLDHLCYWVKKMDV